MKTINLFGKELKFANEELFKCVELAIEMGLKVHTFNPSGFVISQIFVENSNTFGSISASFGGVTYSTCHKSERNSGNGTGFRISRDWELASTAWINRCFDFAPNWAKNTHLIKKETFSDHISRPVNSILKYAEIKF